ncbi:MAG: homocysteine S-methyltransferase family protein [Chloroflexi bacterium]|nr:homocysteine S-methyltransferase family protein [Chloroflexota bacterium]
MRAIDSLQSRLKAGEVIIMDGGTGSELHRRGLPVSDKIWSGEALFSQPDAIREIHEDYIKAGAEIVITNTFSTGRHILEVAGLGDRTVEIIKLGVKLAREARDKAATGKPVIIAGSMSGYSPLLDPTVTPSYEAALTDYREQSKALAEGGVDLIVVEMLIRTLDARAAAEAAAETGLPVWIGYSVVEDEGKLYLGLRGKHINESIRYAVEAVSPAGVSAFFIMHSSLEITAPGLRELRRCTDVPIGAYAHTISRYLGPLPRDMDWRDLSPEDYLGYARAWVKDGGQIIGGCCGTTPEHIRALKTGLQDRIEA